jgi:hemolysin type calcium-binding protein
LLPKNTAIGEQRRQEPEGALYPLRGKRRRKMRKKTIMVVALTALLVALVAIPAVAVNKVCGPNAFPCNGTDNRDYLAERVGKERDRIFGFNSNDVLDANNYRKDRDKLFGGRQNDTLYTNDTDGRDLADGGRGFDRCYVDEGDNTRRCERVL